jgi:diguanylate cyclase (GGDEF)-like protein
MDTDEFQDLHWLLDVIQSADIGILVLDGDFKVEVFNRFMQVHSGVTPERVIGKHICDVFPYLNNDWFVRKVSTVFDLGISVYSTWEQRDSIFEFALKLPVHHGVDVMYQNVTFVPLRSSTDVVERVGIIVYDVTDMANNKRALEAAKDDLLALSQTDRLTGLFNRGHWDARLREEFSRYHRSRESAVLVMLDIDHFKQVNDNYGHQAGDEAIKFVANSILAVSRTIDISGRYGGEEFVMVLPYTDRSGGFTFCERLRESIANTVVKTQGQSLSFTVSLGFAELTPEVLKPEVWLKRADEALYQSKEQGRNRTTVFTAEVKA